MIEGNTRIATYKLLTGILTPPPEFAAHVLPVDTAVKEALSSVDCSIAPNRDALLPIMANSHFGRGDKSRWGFLGSRKAVYDERRAGKSIPQLANVFGIPQSEIRDLILEYELYLTTLKFDWTDAERSVLINPGVAFNPPVRFLESTGHRALVGVEFDRTNLSVTFANDEARRRMKHLTRKLVVTPERGLGATASYAEVFKDYVAPKVTSKAAGGKGQGASITGNAAGASGLGGAGGAGSTQGSTGSSQNSGTSSTTPNGSSGTGGGAKPNKGFLFNYKTNVQSQLIRQLMTEASQINTIKLPGAGTSLLRAIVEAVCKNIIEDQGANKLGKRLSLETSLDICVGNTVTLPQEDKKALKEFQRSHLDYVNLSTHASVVPNHARLVTAKDSIDQFVMRNV